MSEQLGARGTGPPEGDLAERLERFLADQTGARTVAVRNLARLSGGAVHQTWAFDATLAGGTLPGEHALVVRMSAPGREDPAGMEREYGVLRAAHEAGVPVPRVLFLGDGSVGTPFFVMERVAGQTNPGRLVRDARLRARAFADLAGILARIHAVPVDRLPAGLPRPPAECSPAEHAVAEVEARYREAALDPHPVLELALRWLRREAPARCRSGRPVGLVHGDFRVGNLLYDEDGAVQAVLDWEAAHVGDPMEDLGWLCLRFWRFGNDGLPVGGLGTREAFAQAYQQRSGLPVDWDAWTFWEVLGNVRWGVGTMVQARAHLDGHTRSQELAAIGRRTAETEIAILELIG
ncbi:MAG TPA: phosphotransferase family protein [Dehalococcoidia bacterium]